jgi:hypothetical protein
MSLINDYTAQVLTDQQERELVELASRDPHARRALNRQGTWWNRLLSRRERTSVATKRGGQTGTRAPRHQPAQ